MRSVLVLFVLLGWTLAVTPPAHAEVKLAAIFGDHMVLQKDRPIPIWGSADPREKIAVELGARSVHTTADATGHWRVKLPALGLGGPLELVVTGTNRIALTDILMGEVWIASGQSNMEFRLEQADGGQDAIHAAFNPKIRWFQVARGKHLADYGQDVKGAWSVANPETIGQLSAVGYFFAKDILHVIDQPIGIVDTTWGGTSIEGWTRIETMRKRAPESIPPVPATSEGRETAQKAYLEAQAAWDKENTYADPPNTGEGLGFARPETSEADWHDMPMPSVWEDHGIDGDGSIWFRKTVAVPAGWAGKTLDLSLGRLYDCDQTYVNGTKVGENCHNTPETFGKAQIYKVPGKLVRAGKLVIATRLFDEGGRGGFMSEAAALFLCPSGGGEGSPRVPLDGPWKYKIEKLLPTLKPNYDQKPQAPIFFPNPLTPGGLWETMVRPIVPFGMRGVIWYQGETNAGRAVQYRKLFPLMINDWRQVWGQGDFPFYFVQLAGYHSASGFEEEWPELREAQTLTMKVRSTGMAVAIDIGNAKDIHPKNKKEVARRLSLWALRDVYKQKIEVSGPLYASSKTEGASLRIAFSHAAALRVRSGESTLMGFTIAGEDRKFVEAEARIDGATVVVSSRDVVKPVAVRYGWAGPPPCNLENGDGLPASPFRTDGFPEVTRGRK